MDSEDESDRAETGRPATNSCEKRRTQNAIFDSWLSSESVQESLSAKSTEKSRSDPPDGELSISSLMAKSGAEIIKSPREYQLELFERAKNENTIAVLDTGSGKTLIAILLLRHIIDKELEDRYSGKLPRISFFLVASVTLVYQQFSVLQTNLDHNVARCCGADNTDNWDKKKWSRLFSEHKVIVCTADILYQCLWHSYINMRQINLLIFDEAHHAKKNHSYAKIIKEFYIGEELGDLRPRIFSMTASPTNAKSDVFQAASELEAMLNSKIVTTIDPSLTEAVKKPAEQVLRYTCLAGPLETPFLQSVKNMYGHVEPIQGILEKAPEIAQQLGSWCADRFLADALSEKNLLTSEGRLERRFHKHRVLEKTEKLDDQIAELRQAFGFAQQERVKHTSTQDPQDGDLSSKVLQLKRYLSAEFERPSSHRCIVFAEQRDTARLLSALFQVAGTQHMRCAFLVGTNSADTEQNSFSFRQQVVTLMKFRKGEINCLFATSIAEEGLDVPDCNLVIRFDMYKTMIQYIQSRGRARNKNSNFVHMMETGNAIHQQLLYQVRSEEAAMRDFCQKLPKDQNLARGEESEAMLPSYGSTKRFYKDPLTGAKLTYDNALACLEHFVSAIPDDSDEPLHATYILGPQNSRFVAEVILPGSAPIRSAVGRVCTRKMQAKRSAAFEMCVQLRQKQYLDEYLMPAYQKKLPAMRNALLAVNMTKKSQYVMRTKPTVWEKSRGSSPTELWITIVDFAVELERPHQPLALLTRTQMPRFPTFPIFRNDGTVSTVVSKTCGRLQVSAEMLSKLSTFTFRVFKDVFSKTFEADEAKLSYWLAPASADQSRWDDPMRVLDWKTLDDVFENEEYPWTPETPNEFLTDKFLVDKWDGGRKFYSIAVDDTLRPQDAVPDGSAKAKWESSILDYSVSLWKNARERAVWNPDQPVMKTEKLLARRNMLATPGSKEVQLRTQAFLCPEPLRISALPTTVVVACSVWPAIIHRFESCLIAMEACDMVGVICDVEVALAAITKDSDNSDENQTVERINFQHGMGDNYERLEFIGDTFLKTATTISTFVQNPNDNEFEFHVKRMLLLCNKNLFGVAVKLQLYEYIRSMSFSRRIWYPEGLKLLEGKGAGKDPDTAVIKHALGEKTIADVCEALIGAAYVTHDKPGEEWKEEQWENAVRAVTKLVDSPDHTMMCWNDYRDAYQQPAYQTGAVTASQRDLAEKVELEHPYRFTYPRLLRSAFIHPSQPFTYEKVPNYQRLEFLGDALLDMVSITHLFYRFPDKDPQWLTEHKMAMVSNKFLGVICVDLGFHKHLRYTSSILESQIRGYVTELLEAKHTSEGHPDYWTTVTEPPKCLPDIVEAFVGAMFIDSDFNYGHVQKFFDMHMKSYFEDMSKYDTFANNHPCTHLQNLLQTTYGCRDYRVMVKELPAADGVEMERKDVVAVVMIHDQIITHAKGKSGRYSRIRVANNAIDIIDGMAPFEFRRRFECDCHLEDGGTAMSGGAGSGDVDKLAADCEL